MKQVRADILLKWVNDWMATTHIVSQIVTYMTNTACTTNTRRIFCRKMWFVLRPIAFDLGSVDCTNIAERDRYEIRVNPKSLQYPLLKSNSDRM